MHSRRKYSQIASVFEAKIKSWEWAIESMQSLHFEKVTFGASTIEIIKALHQPSLWPSIVSHISPLLDMTMDKTHWYIIFEPTICNIGTSLIAESVINDIRVNSYVARGYPSWLKGFFEHDQQCFNL